MKTLIDYKHRADRVQIGDRLADVIIGLVAIACLAYGLWWRL